MRARFLLGALILAVGVCPAGFQGSASAAPPPSEGAGSKAGSPAVVNAPDEEVLTRRERYFYSSFARRDPFGSLISGSFASTHGGDLLDIGEISLVGVVWGEEDKFAVVQDVRKHVHVLRVGDRVVNGKVVRVTRTNLTVQHYFFGETANVTIQMSQGEGSNETP